MRRINSHGIKLDLSLVLLLLVSIALKVSHSEGDLDQCEHIVKKWASSSLDTEVKEDKHVLRDLLFFLHVPRTGGRTYFHCFLKKLYSSSLECPRSYDKLRFNPRKPDCRLLVTHDDYSMMSKLPKEKTSVVTILRKPVDRVFSTYEFSVEVAARFLVHPNLTSVTRMAGRLRSKTKGISTLDIWPWKYLVPWMREDLFARRDARIFKGQIHSMSNDSYNMEDIVMPLHQYIHDPTARDIIHNGATFQIVGLTNNSYLPESHEVRHCVLKYQTLGQYVLNVAKKRLDDMLYVGLTENHKESATMFANVVGAQVISQFTPSSYSEASEIRNNSEQSYSSQDSDYHESNSTYQKAGKSSRPERITAGKLMDTYETCTSSLRKAQAERRVNSLKRISPANFTKKARSKVPEGLIKEIESLNSLDVELYEYAEGLFSKQHGRMVQNIAAVDKVVINLNNSYDLPTSWNILLWIISVILVVVSILVFVNARRRTSKLKL